MDYDYDSESKIVQGARSGTYRLAIPRISLKITSSKDNKTKFSVYINSFIDTYIYIYSYLQTCYS